MDMVGADDLRQPPDPPALLSSRTVLASIAASAPLTWFGVRSFGDQGPLAAAVAVLLVELFLACIAVLAVLLTVRVSSSYLLQERNFREPEDAARRPRRRSLWRVEPERGELLTPVSRNQVVRWLKSLDADTVDGTATQAADPPEGVPQALRLASGFADGTAGEFPPPVLPDEPGADAPDRATTADARAESRTESRKSNRRRRAA
jgi:hypothetical protein